ncbi:hypothetical protein DMN91_009512 [Ooceraea biroi]|uniref:Fatty acid hydroxylase domain-containing protein n=1 Tax=Ooceraea biroi TaxID=2015173 RepID=A0A3L8DFI3_OOCBI|nr:hypothetical protein DMN91_009512 [Ooceraea biroi]
MELFYDFIFYSPLAIFIHPYYIIKTREFIYLYQLFIHTEVIKKVGSFEGIFNTPNYQRIHHSFNRAYLDKNYGGIFILWDRMFGTFKEKGSGPIDYSIPESPQCYGILYQQIYGIICWFVHKKNLLFTRFWFKALFYGPRWIPDNNVINESIPRLGYEKCDMDFLSITRAFGKLHASLCICAYFLENLNKTYIILANVLRSLFLYNYYYTSPAWCSYIYYLTLYYDGLYCLVLFFHYMIYMLRQKLDYTTQSIISKTDPLKE